MYTTPNYMFCFNILKRVFYMQSIKFDDLYGNKEATENFILKVLYLMVKNFRTPCPPQYLQLPVAFEEKYERKAIIISLPDAKCECDCNFVALRKSKDGKLLFISSELYEFGYTFKLCVFTEQAHYSLSKVITSYQEFVDAALELGDNFN